MNFDSCIKVSLKLHIYYLPWYLILFWLWSKNIFQNCCHCLLDIRKISVYHIRLLWWVCPPSSWAEASRRPQVQLYLSLTLITLNPHLKATPDKHYSGAYKATKYKGRILGTLHENRELQIVCHCQSGPQCRCIIRFIVLVFYQSNPGV